MSLETLKARAQELKAINNYIVDFAQSKIDESYYQDIVVVSDDVVVATSVATDVEPDCGDGVRIDPDDSGHPPSSVDGIKTKITDGDGGSAVIAQVVQTEDKPIDKCQSPKTLRPQPTHDHRTYDEDIEYSTDPLYFNSEAVAEFEATEDPDEEEVATANVRTFSDVKELFVSMFEDIEQLGHLRDFDQNWGGPRKGYSGLTRIRKSGERDLYVSYNLAGQRLAVRCEVDGIQVMYEREQRIELASATQVEVVDDAITVIEFFS